MKTRADIYTFNTFRYIAFRKEIIFCLIHYIQPSENTFVQSEALVGSVRESDTDSDFTLDLSKF